MPDNPTSGETRTLPERIWLGANWLNWHRDIWDRPEQEPKCGSVEYIRADGRFMAVVREMRQAMKCAADMLGAAAGDIEDGGSLTSLRGKYVLALTNVRDGARSALAALDAEMKGAKE